jgi:hypothetical protein
MQKALERFGLPLAPLTCQEFSLHAMAIVVRDRRGYQDYSTWLNFGTASLYEDIAASPNVSGELIAQHLHRLQLKNPSEQTSADVAAGILVATYGPAAGMLAQPQLQSTYDWFKARQNLQLVPTSMLAVTTAYRIHIYMVALTIDENLSGANQAASP